MKKIITVVIIAALVLAAFSILSMQSVRADTSEARILSYSMYVAPSTTVIASEPGDLIVVGELENVGSNVIGNVTIQGIAFNSTEQEVASTTTQAFVYYTLPNQRALFYLDFTASSSTTQNLSWVFSVSRVALTVTSVTDTVDRQYAGLTVPTEGGSSPYVPNATYYVIGTVENTGNQAAQDPWVVTTFYNSTGSVVGLNFTDYLSNSMSPGEALRFIASPADDTAQLTSEIANYSLTVDSLTLSNSTVSPTPTPSPTGTTSTAQFPTLPVVVAVIVVVIVVIVVALMLLRKRQKTTPPPPPPPPMP